MRPGESRYDRNGTSASPESEPAPHGEPCPPGRNSRSDTATASTTYRQYTNLGYPAPTCHTTQPVTRSNFDPVAARLRGHLREKRLRAGLTQAALGRRLKHTQQWVYKYEAGERRLDVVEFIEIARAIGFDPGEFISRFTNEMTALDAAPPCDPPQPASSTKTPI